MADINVSSVRYSQILPLAGGNAMIDLTSDPRNCTGVGGPIIPDITPVHLFIMRFKVNARSDSGRSAIDIFCITIVSAGISDCLL